MADLVREIPTTTHVPPYEENTAETWVRAVGGFCDGAQSVKRSEDLYSIRIGEMIHVEGNCTSTTQLPVAPRIDTFIPAIIDGIFGYVSVQTGSKVINTSAEEYSINGTYLADIRRNT